MSNKMQYTHPSEWRGKHDLKVIGTGFARTGSYSLRLALEQLGIAPCFHVIDCQSDKKKAKALMWWKGIENRLKADKESVNFDEFYSTLANGVQAGLDWPTCLYWEELAEFYPKAKLILTVRDKEKWYRSCITTLNFLHYNPLLRLLIEFVDLLHFEATELMPKGMEEFGGMDAFYADKQRVFDRVDERIEIMRTDERYKDRVLIFEVKQGWDPLCKFLNVEVPKTPFPRSNDGAALAQKVNRHLWQTVQEPVAMFGRGMRSAWPFMVGIAAVAVILSCLNKKK